MYKFTILILAASLFFVLAFALQQMSFWITFMDTNNNNDKANAGFLSLSSGISYCLSAFIILLVILLSVIKF